MTSKSIYQPYFYIIQHKLTKIMYAGSRYAKGCHPDEFMQPNGYTTSSSIINQIIEQEGLDSFEVLRIDTNLDGISTYQYESEFLKVNRCSLSDNWYNLHDNSDICPAYGTVEFKNLMIKKYGKATYNNMEKNRSTCLEKYGVDHPNKRESEKPRLSEAAKKLNSREDMIAMLYARNHSQNNPWKLKENIEKTSIRMKSHSVRLYQEGNHPMQKQTNKDAASERMKITMANLPILKCPHCGLEGKGSNMPRWHFDNCKHKSNQINYIL